MTRIGIISDTHLYEYNLSFQRSVTHAFNDCSVIIHAGDLTDITILKAFKGKDIYAVHGNMCNRSTRQALPEQNTFVIDGFTFGLSHGAGQRSNIEDRMFDLFPIVDCIVYGHTHKAVCHRIGATLFINPGSFQSTGPYGAQGTYGIVTIDSDGIHGKILQLP